MSSDTLARGRILRGSVAAAVRGAAMDADLALLRPASVAVDAPATGDTAVVIDEARRLAAQTGYEDGFEAGRREAAEQVAAEAAAARTALAQALAAVEAAAQSLSARQDIVVADVERQITTTALAIAEAVVGRELATAHDPGLDAITRALRLAPGKADAVAALHPEDVATLGDLSAVAGNRTVTVIADASVERGGCLVQVGPCSIDAQVGPALQRVQAVLAP